MSTAKPLRIATRKSPLALWQAEFVRVELLKRFPDLEIELIKLTTQGDRILDTPLAKIGGKGLFIKELEHKLLCGEADIAVHSTKDMPAELPEGLIIGAICEREDPRDAFVSNHYKHFDELPTGARVGTSSLRRQCQIRAHRPDLHIGDLRGNVNTRLQKLDDNVYDAIVLASAGLKRLGMGDRIADFLDTSYSLPAVGQGAVCIECRHDDNETLDRVSVLNHVDTSTCVRAERAMNHKLQGGCQVPIGGYAEVVGNQLHLRGLVGAVDGSEIIRDEVRGKVEEAEILGNQLADKLLQQGAREILQSVYERNTS